MEILNNALQSLPDTVNQDSKLLINTELMEVESTETSGSKETDVLSDLDRQMCEIIDDM